MEGCYGGVAVDFGEAGAADDGDVDGFWEGVSFFSFLFTFISFLERKKKIM